jgi:hypothetical protein
MVIPDAFLAVFVLGVLFGLAVPRLLELGHVTAPRPGPRRGCEATPSALEGTRAPTREFQPIQGGDTGHVVLRPRPFDWAAQAPEVA